jgi:uridine phosphorylase
LRKFFDSSSPLLKPADLVLTFTHKSASDLALPRRALIVFDVRDLNRLVKETAAERIEAWSPFRNLFRVAGKETLLVKSNFGGPNIAALVEEFSAFGVREFCVWGYCGAINQGVSLGEIVLATEALREEGISYHYLENEEEYVPSEWAREWEEIGRRVHLVPGRVWTCDALYREGRDKAAKYAGQGVLGVEMEVASLYAVCLAKGLKAVAFLVVSDLVHETGWEAGFGTPALKEGAKRLLGFILSHVIV